MRLIGMGFFCVLLTQSIALPAADLKDVSRPQVAVDSEQFAKAARTLAGSFATVVVVRWEECQTADYETMNETLWRMRNISVLVCDNAHRSTLEHLWLERLANQGVQVVPMHRAAGLSANLDESQLQQAHHVLLKLLPDRREQLDNNYLRARDQLLRQETGDQLVNSP